MDDRLQQGKAAHQAGRLEDADRLYQMVLSADPRNPEALRLMGALAAQRQDYATAEHMLSQAIELAPFEASTHYNLALVHMQSGRTAAAAQSCERALALNPAHASARNAHAMALIQLNRHAEALAQYDLLCVQLPADAVVHCWRGTTLMMLKRPLEALESFNRSLTLRHSSKALIGRAVALQSLQQNDDAIAAFQEIVSLEPLSAALRMSLGDALLAAGRTEDAITSYNHAYALEPTLPWLAGNRRYAKMKICDWSNYEQDRDALLESVRRGEPAASTLVTVEAGPELQQICARLHAAKFRVEGPKLWNGERYNHARIRIAYVSKDFCEHPNITLAAELFERHDRSQFEVFAIALGRDDGSSMRKRLEAAFEHFHRTENMDERSVAELIRSLEIDIAVDLDGYSIDSLPKIFAYRPAPVAVNYLGYPGTVGSPTMDYIIADRVILPEDDRRFYDEQAVYLPHTYQANSRRIIAENTPTRVEAGLPENGFVFCCFNSAHKITPFMFDIWMRLLTEVEGSVLWLLGADPVMQGNLRREAVGRGVAAERLIFAARLKAEDHLARHRLADLFLDTLPYNAHTTASDALWAGLPVVTCLGNNFPGRVCAGLLGAIGLEELITASLGDYEALVLALAQNPARLAAIRERLVAKRDITPLFDCAAYTRDLEAAYRVMWQRQQDGKAPESFAV